VPIGEIPRTGDCRPCDTSSSDLTLLKTAKRHENTFPLGAPQYPKEGSRVSPTCPTHRNNNETKMSTSIGG